MVRTLVQLLKPMLLLMLISDLFPTIMLLATYYLLMRLWFQISKLLLLLVGLYEGTYTVSSTEEVVGGDNYGNNSLERNFEVTTDVYSQDGIDVQPASILSLGSLGSNSFTSELSNTVLAAMYHMRETENQVNGIQIALASGSAEGGELTDFNY